MRIEQTIIALFVTSLFLMLPHHKTVLACSTFKLQKGNALVYGHNLNEGDIGVPGLVFINKRGIFKKGRSWSEIITKDRLNPSSHSWISRYGSVTFNNFGKDFPDGGMNEAGLFIWEMNEEADYPKNDSLPKLNQMNWMQYILDNFSTTAEAIKCASEVEIDGWTWHYFVGDAKGKTAAIAFIKGKVVVHSGDDMPIPALFNTPYKRELELLKYFEGFGGEYKPDINDPNVPRFVRTATLINQYNPETDPIDYGFYMLKTLRVYDDPEWSVLFDANGKNVYFRTRMSPEMKIVDMTKIDFNNSSPARVININTEFEADVLPRFKDYNKEIMQTFLQNELMQIVPQDFYGYGGLSADEFVARLVDHTDSYTEKQNHFFNGKWIGNAKGINDLPTITLLFSMNNDAVAAELRLNNENQSHTVDNLQMIGKQLCFTFHSGSGKIIEFKGHIQNDRLTAQLFGIENFYGHYTFQRILKKTETNL
ncbi:linear amide C-N hydrolase [uncultured Draconibacterium sp.]|uniref:linear amide C-N hydrolase n=1 Tax=uncultured Draconibacterium sp. TaxID=1573823 RepID=UPI0025E70861|nr:linear amide C-N hydrolase [uncultured Draconibacterium sp.]